MTTEAVGTAAMNAHKSWMRENCMSSVAKGVDLIARKIREVAEAHGIPVVENPPLACALHGTVEIDQEIPQEHYRAVAEIIGYLMRLRRLVAR